MKKLVTAFILCSIFMNVQAANDTCRADVVYEKQQSINNISYTLRYLDNYVDMNGDFEESHLEMTFTNIPEDIYIMVSSEDGKSYVDSSSASAVISGGVYTVEYYTRECEGLLKTHEIKAPHYKQYCEINDNCDEDPFFDGTYENKEENQKNSQENKVNIRLVIILIVLIIIIAVIVFIFIKRRNTDEKRI